MSYYFITRPLVYGAWIAYTREPFRACGVELTKADYRPMFIIFTVAAVVTMILMMYFKFEVGLLFMLHVLLPLIEAP